jgi:hypothetical protein
MHAAAAYWALVIVAVHLGWHWDMIISVVNSRLSITTFSALRTGILRVLTAVLAVFGVVGWLQIDIASKLLLQMSLVGWDFEASTPAFFLHHAAIIGLCASMAHYTMMFFKSSNAKARNGKPKQICGVLAGVAFAQSGSKAH